MTGALESAEFHIGHDRGYAERFQYVKEASLVLLFLSLAFVSGSRGYVVWALVFGYLLVDDMLQIHETLGELAATSLELSAIAGLRPEDIGQLIVSAVAGIVLLSPLLLYYAKDKGDFRIDTRCLLLLILALAFFGVLLDAVHIVVDTDWLDAVLAIVEDGGEMIVMSAMLAYASKSYLKASAPRSID